MLGFIPEDHVQQDIYINTYSQKQSGDDTDFVVTTGQSISNIMALELNTFRMVNFLSNFDRGFNEDLRDFTLIINGQRVLITADQFYQTIGVFYSWLGTQIGGFTVTYSLDPVLNYLITGMQFKSGGTPQTFQLVGAGWKKLGFQLGTQQNSLDATSPYDLSQTCMVNIYIDALPSGISCSQGAISFTVANTSSFGGVLTFESTQASGNKKICFQQPINLPSLLHIQLQNEEQQQLTTVRGKNTTVNQTGLECIIVLKAWIRV